MNEFNSSNNRLGVANLFGSTKQRLGIDCAKVLLTGVEALLCLRSFRHVIVFQHNVSPLRPAREGQSVLRQFRLGSWSMASRINCEWSSALSCCRTIRPAKFNRQD